MYLHTHIAKTKNLSLSLISPNHIENKYTCRIYVEDLLALGVENGTAEQHPSKHSVVTADQSYCGEIQVGITFTRKVNFHICMILNIQSSVSHRHDKSTCYIVFNCVGYYGTKRMRLGN